MCLLLKLNLTDNIEVNYSPLLGNNQNTSKMKRTITLLLFFIITLVPITQSTQAQVGVTDVVDIQMCATDSCDVRLVQSKLFYAGWELKIRCFIDGQWQGSTDYGDGVYSGSL
jgi:hypothetical protein